MQACWTAVELAKSFSKYFFKKIQKRIKKTPCTVQSHNHFQALHSRHSIIHYTNQYTVHKIFQNTNQITTPHTLPPILLNKLIHFPPFKYLKTLTYSLTPYSLTFTSQSSRFHFTPPTNPDPTQPTAPVSLSPFPFPTAPDRQSIASQPADLSRRPHVYRVVSSRCALSHSASPTFFNHLRSSLRPSCCCTHARPLDETHATRPTLRPTLYIRPCRPLCKPQTRPHFSPPPPVYTLKLNHTPPPLAPTTSKSHQVLPAHVLPRLLVCSPTHCPRRALLPFAQCTVRSSRIVSLTPSLPSLINVCYVLCPVVTSLTRFSSVDHFLILPSFLSHRSSPSVPPQLRTSLRTLPVTKHASHESRRG